MHNSVKLVLLLTFLCAVFAPLAPAQGPSTSCPDNARALFTAVMSYALDNDEFLPPLNNEAAIEQALMPYVQSQSVFRCPVTNQYYRFNPNLSGVSGASIATDLGNTVLLRDSTPHPDGKITVAYMDGMVTEGGVDPTAEADCARFAQNLAIAIRSYAQDYDEVLPPMQNPLTLHQVLYPYVRDNRAFKCPVTGAPFVPNPNLSGLRLSAISDASKTVVVRDALPHPDGKVTVAFLDGSVLQGGVDPFGDPDCVNFVQRLMGGILGYANSHGGILPTLHNDATFQALLMPIVQNSRVFTCPATGKLYALNSNLSGVNLATIPDSGVVVLVRDAQPHADQKLTVGFLDGHVLRGGVAQPNPEVACLTSVKQLTLASNFYMQDHDQTLPPMQTFEQFWNAVFPYIKSSWPSRCPSTKLNYVVNAQLSGVSLATISNPSGTWLIRDTQPHPDGRSTYGYVDGHAERH